MRTLIAVMILALAGCASNIEQAAKLLAERPAQSCTTTVDGQEVQFQGAACDRLAETAAQSQALSACAGFAESNEPLCVLALVMAGRNSSHGAKDAEVQLLIAAMNNDTQIKAAYIGAIPGVGQILATAYQAHESEKTLRTALRNGGTRVGSVHVTKSDDGGAIASGDDLGGEGGLPTGSGGGGDQYVTIGSRNNIPTGQGAIVSDGRNANFFGQGEINSSFDPSTVNNQNGQGPGGQPITNAPVVAPEDNDGGNDVGLLGGI